MNRKDYAIEQTKEGIKLARVNVEKLKIQFVEGQCAADKDDPTKPRDYVGYRQNVLLPLIANGTISDGSNGKLDDRLHRYDYSTTKDGKLEVVVGLSHYVTFREDVARTNDDTIELRLKGRKMFDDEHTFLTRSIGVALIPITNEGTIFLGERTNKEDTGLLNGIAGHIQYRDDPSKINLQEDIEREAREELGIESEKLRDIRFVGVYSNPIRGDLDFTFLANVDLTDGYFESGEWMKKVKESEHKPLVKIARELEIPLLLIEGRLPGSNKEYQLMYSTRGTLESIRNGEMKD